MGSVAETVSDLILLTGFSGVGKTTVANILGEVGSFRIINCGDVLKARLASIDVATKSRPEIGTAFLARFPVASIFGVLADEYRRYASEPAILDGVRFALTCEQFREEWPQSRVWHIECDPAIRDERLSLRGVSANDRSRAALGDDDSRFEPIADVIIRNDGTVDELRRRTIDEFRKASR